MASFSARRLLGVALAGALACSGDSTAPLPRAPGDLSAEWPTAAAASQHVDETMLAAAVAHARTLPRVLSLLVVRNGWLVSETYFNGNRADSLNDVRSVTKSVVSTLAGIAVSEGKLSLDSPIGPFLQPWSSQLDAAKRALTPRHLLTMSSGFQRDESTTAGYNEWVLSGDPVAFLLTRPLVAAPGTSFTYNSAAVHLLGVVIQEATGTNIRDFARTRLWAPLGIPGVLWEVFPDGRANGGAGIRMRPRDLAKLGALWLATGDAGSSRVLPPSWVVNGTSPSLSFWAAPPPLTPRSYGWLWWLTRARNVDSFLAWGYGGQFVFVTPSLGLVVVVTTEWRNAGALADQLAANGLDLIINRVLPAVRY